MEPKKIDVGVGVLILNDQGKVLLGRRHTNENKPLGELKGDGQWTMPGGKVDFGELFKAAALRETEEETGLELENVEVFCVNNGITDTAHYVTIGLVGTGFTDKTKSLRTR